MKQLDQLKTFSTIVADSGDFISVKKFAPTDSTTNPSLILQATKNPLYQPLIQEALNYAKKESLVLEGQINHAVEKLLVIFAREILKIIPGRVSLELDPRYSYSTSKSIDKALRMIYLLEQEGINKKRILIKIASTWEGLQAAKLLEKEGIRCNMTLIFCLEQAALAAEARATIISPFVGRILDWYRKHFSMEDYSADKDPGVISVKNIYRYIKHFKYSTKIMAASFRTLDEIYALAGCDLLTIAPKFLEELFKLDTPIAQKLSPSMVPSEKISKLNLTEDNFHKQLRNNQMAFEKLHEGIQSFIKDFEALESLIKNQLLEPVENH